MGPSAHGPVGPASEPGSGPIGYPGPLWASPDTPPIPPLYLGSMGPRVQGSPNGSKGILWEGPRSPPGIPWGSYGIHPRDPWVPPWDPNVPPWDPWVPPQGSLGCMMITPGIPRGYLWTPYGNPGIPRLYPIGSPWGPQGGPGILGPYFLMFAEADLELLRGSKGPWVHGTWVQGTP